MLNMAYVVASNCNKICLINIAVTDVINSLLLTSIILAIIIICIFIRQTGSKNNKTNKYSN